MPLRWMPDCRPRLGARPHVRKRLILARRALIIAAMTHAGNPPLDDARYLALQARDARFDGCFFTGVTSTGIYCRPVCRVRIPKRENCRFFAYAAQAEQAGFRPCLRCRPELAPRAPALGQAPDTRPWSIQDASSILARQALRLLGTPEAWDRCVPTVRQLALRLGVSDRHLRRIFDSAFGVSPLHYLQTQRLLNAKQLLTDTRLGVTQVAHLSGFASLRRFNAAFVQHYALNPTRLRREDAGVKTGIRKAANPGIHLRLAYRPPYDAPAMLQFLAMRQISGIEEITPTLARLCKTIAVQQDSKRYTGWIDLRFDASSHRVDLHLSESLCEVLPSVIARVRAVLGQQVTVAAARTLATRLVQQLGEPIDTPIPALNRLFPTPAALAAASGDMLGQLGIVRQRQAAIRALANAVANEGLQLHGGVDVPATLAVLQAMPGIGDWTAQYIAMRALRWPDAFPAGDVALHKALGLAGVDSPARHALAASQAWQPWRSYAVIRAWTSSAAAQKKQRAGASAIKATAPAAS